MKMLKWYPGNGVNSLYREMDRFFSPEVFGPVTQSSNWVPSMDVVETEKEFALSLELPGMSKDEVNVTVADGNLIVEGERKEEAKSEDKQVHRIERRYGKFVRSISLPEHIDPDKIDANFKDGILTVSLPKTEAALPKKINVKIS